MCLPFVARFCTVVYLFSIAIQLNAQNIQVRYLGIENGLSNNAVNTIFQDHNGFMWFGTYDGLNRYDGYSFKTYRNVIDDSTSICSNNINTIDEDVTHRLWVGGQKGLSIYNPATATFSYPSYAFYNKSLKANLNDNILAVKAVKGTGMLVGTQHNGLFYFSDHRNGRQIPLKINGKIKLDYYVSAMGYDEKKNAAYVFIADYGLYEFDLRNGLLQPKNSEMHTGYCLKVTHDGRLWLGNDRGLFFFNEATNSLSESIISYRGPVVNLCEDKKGDLWIATDGAGAWILTQGGKKALPLQSKTAGDRSLLNSNSIYAVYEDKEGRKWIGTLRGGINIIEPATPFAKVVYQPEGNNSSVENFIFSFCEDEPGRIWIGTDGAGLRYWNRTNNTYQTFAHNENVPGSITSNFITSIVKDAQNNVWLSTWFGGINRYNKATKSFEHYTCFNTRTKGYDNNVWRLLTDDKQRLWACAVRGGALYKFNEKNKTFEEFDNNLSELQAIAQDRQGNIWAGDYSALILVDTVYKQHKVYNVGYPVRCIYEDKKNNFWIGTQEGGLMLFNRTNHTFKRYTTKEGLPNNTILRMLEDETGKLWLSTYDGLARFNPASEECQNFYQSDGLQSNQFSFNAALSLSSGEFLFGGIKGFNVFHPDGISNKNTFPNLYLSGLRINNSPIEENEAFIKERSFEQVKRIEVPYEKALLTLDYLGLDYADVSNISYAYRLSGWDKQWNYVANTRTASYSRLQEGHYIFEVKVSNKKGGWSEAQTLLYVTVLPPWYRTWWAYGLYGLAAFSLLYLYALYKNRQAKLRYQIQLANLEMQKEKELNEKKIAFFTNVSHEFRAPLSLIINPIKDLLHKTEHRTETAELQVIYRNAKRLLRMVDQLLLFKKAEQNLDQLNLQKQNVYDLCRDVYLCFIEQARSRKIRYELQGEAKGAFINADREKIEIALFNLLSNAFKFTPEGGTIAFRIKETNAGIALSISDTGPGIPEDESQKLFERFVQLNNTGNKGGFGIGLYLVKNFVEAHGGTVTFESEKGSGTTFHINLNKVREDADAISIFSDTQQSSSHKTDGQKEHSLIEAVSLPAPVSAILEEMTEDVVEPQEETEMPVAADELATEKQSLLVVDDDKEIRHYLVEVFASKYKIYQANNGREGIRLAKQHLPDLIISDIVMQDGNGLELCRTLKEDSALSHIPIVLLTGTSSDEMQLEGMNSGADDYIKKPFDKEILMARVGAILKRRNILQSYFYNEVTLGSAKFKVSTEYKEFIERCMKIIEDHLLDDDFPIKSLAAEMGMSHSALYKKIRAVSGQSVNSFIRFVRLKRAAELFISTELNVNETATMVGFGNLKYFRTQFHNQFGLNPSEYIKKFRKPFHHNQTLDEKLVR